MDYTVGSVSDIISGKNTPNKSKLIKKEFLTPKSETIETNNVQESKKKRKNKSNSYEKDSENVVPYKRNKPMVKEQTLKDKSFKKKNKTKSIENTDDDDSFTVIDHTQLEKLHKAIKEEADVEGIGDVKLEDTKEANVKEEADEGIGDVKLKDTKEAKVDQKEINSRTVFVGNVAVNVTKVKLLRKFGKYGKIASVRLRCATPANPGVSKRVAVIKKMLHPKRTTLHSYVTFEKREDALKALELNGQKYKEHHLRVQMCDDTAKPDSNKAIFVGNLPFDVEDDDLWKAFESCGSINSVRVVRNSSTGMGIGIGYVNFNSSDSVELALQMDDVTIGNKTVRIQRCHDNKKSRKLKYMKKKKSEKKSHNEEKKNVKKFKQEKGEEGKSSKSVKQKKEKPNTFDKPSVINVKKSVFQGSKSNKKKHRPKANKGIIQKIKLSQKVAPKL